MKTFYVGIKAVLFYSNNLLPVKRKIEDTYYWEMPGGRINDGESIEVALRREVKEEIGLNGISVNDLLYAHRVPENLSDGQGLVLIYYKCQTEKNEIILSSEHTDYKWIDKNELDSFFESENGHISNWTMEAINKALS